MSTILAQESYCGWCGAPDAPSMCPCKQASFCNQTCHKLAWPSHRLICTHKAGQSNKTTRNKLTEGDIVVIEGLQSEKGQLMNGCLAEVQSYDSERERYAVLFTPPKSFKVEGVMIKKENLTLQLAVSEAALKSKNNQKELRKLWNKMVDENLTEVDQLPPAAETVELVRKGDPSFTNAVLIGPPTGRISRSELLALFDHGLIDACLEDYPFPLCIDAESRPSRHPRLVAIKVLIISSSLESLGSGKQYNRLCGEVGGKLGPLILLICTKKKRLFGAADHWWNIQNEGLGTISRCISETTGCAAVLGLQKEVLAALMEHTVFMLTVDPAVFLLSNSSLAKDIATEDWMARANNYSLALDIAMTLSDPDKVGVKNACRFGCTKIPAGAKGGDVDYTFSSCVLDVFARATMEMDKEEPSTYIQWHAMQSGIIGGFIRVQMQSPDFAREMDLSITSPEDLETFLACHHSAENYLFWCRERMENRIA